MWACQFLFQIEDEHLAHALGMALQEHGLEITWDEPLTPSTSAAVVLLSSRSTSDDVFRERLARIPESVRIVPVKLDVFDAEGLPDRLLALNWIIWPVDQEAPTAQVHQALRIPEATHVQIQELYARAESWTTGGRDDSHLLNKQRAYRSAVAALYSWPANEREPLRSYLQASYRASRRQRRRSVRRGLVRGWIALGLITATVGTFQTWQFEQQRATLWTVVGQDAAVEYAPEAQAIKMSALMLYEQQHGKSPDASVVATLQRALSLEWRARRDDVSPTHKAINDTALFGSGLTQVWADGGGSIWRVVGAEDPVAVAHLEETPLNAVAASLDGGVIAAANEEVTSVIRGGRPTSLDRTLAGTIKDVQLDEAGEYLTMVSDQGVERVALARPGRAPDVWRADSVAAVGGPQVATVIGEKSGRPYLHNLETGITLPIPRRVFGALSKANIGVDGSVLVAGADRQLWTSSAPVGPHEVLWRPTGIPVPDVVTALKLSSADEAVVSSANEGTQLFDLRHGVSLGSVCLHSVAYDLAVSPDHDWLACQAGYSVEVVRLAELRPVHWGGWQEAPAQRAFASGTTSEIVEGGWYVEVAQAAARNRIDVRTLEPIDGPATAVGVSPDGMTMLVGGVGGVAEFDVTGSGALQASQWRVPDGSAVRGFRWQGNRATVVSDSASWRFLGCRGCGADPKILAHVTRIAKERCQPFDYTRFVPRDIVAQLDLHECRHDE